MDMFVAKRFRVLLVFVASAFVAGSAHAQIAPYPSKSIRMVIALAPRSGSGNTAPVIRNPSTKISGGGAGPSSCVMNRDAPFRVPNQSAP